MIVRKLSNGQINLVNVSNEDAFLEVNKNNNTFMKVNSLPNNPVCPCWKLDSDNNIVVDLDRVRQTVINMINDTIHRLLTNLPKEHKYYLYQIYTISNITIDINKINDLAKQKSWLNNDVDLTTVDGWSNLTQDQQTQITENFNKLVDIYTTKKTTFDKIDNLYSQKVNIDTMSQDDLFSLAESLL